MFKTNEKGTYSNVEYIRSEGELHVYRAMYTLPDGYAEFRIVTADNANNIVSWFN